MNVLNRHPTTPDEFLRWNEGREGKWDFVEGRIVDMMVKVSRNHAIIAARLTTILSQSLPFPPFTVSTADFGVRTASSVRYPDVMVDQERGSGADLAAASPVLIAEILSPSTMSIDLDQKAHEYRTVPSLRHYLVLAQDEPRIWVWSRDDGWTGPSMIEGPGGQIVLPAIGLTVQAMSIYSGLFDHA